MVCNHHLQRDHWLRVERLSIGKTMGGLRLVKLKDPLSGTIACGDRGFKTFARIPFTADYPINIREQNGVLFLKGCIKVL